MPHRFRTIAVAVALAGAGALPARLAAQEESAAPGQEAERWSRDRVARLFDDLPSTFDVTGPETLTDPGASVGGFVTGWRYRVGSWKPPRSVPAANAPASNPLALRARLEITRWRDADAVAAAFETVRARAEPETGLSYGWDILFVRDDELYRLQAGCTFSEPWFEHVVERMLAEVAPLPDRFETFRCRCGGGCAEEVLVEGSGGAPAALPTVPHPEGDPEEYDNRLDPSGRWVGDVGELALMHRANTMSFVYLAVFGDPVHVCEGAGVAGLTGTDRYEYVDEQGTIAFLVEPRGVRLELLSGIVSFCGAGWPGERFDIRRFEPPRNCVVTAPEARFHVVDHVDPEARAAVVRESSRLETVAAPGSSEDWVLARYTGQGTGTVGLIRRSEVSCSKVAGGSAPRLR